MDYVSNNTTIVKDQRADRGAVYANLNLGHRAH